MQPRRADDRHAAGGRRERDGDDADRGRRGCRPGHRDRGGRGLRFTIDGKALPPGTHGAHIHTVGRCDLLGVLETAGAHWNPTTRHGDDQHGIRALRIEAPPRRGTIGGATAGVDAVANSMDATGRGGVVDARRTGGPILRATAAGGSPAASCR
ncbi:superoxide dismutase family protein [Sphingomonas sp. MMS24-JH45]